jgi:thymidine kinase
MYSKGGVEVAKLYYKYSTMKGGKSLELLKTADTYERTGKRALLFTSSKDTRSGTGIIKSRLGISRNAYVIESIEDVKVFVQIHNVDVVLIDEAQFINAQIIERLARGVVDELDVPVVAFGLKNTFKNELFEGAAALMAYADSIEEIKGLCECCNRKATMNLRLNNGRPVYDGDTIQVGDEEYKSVCRKHFYKYQSGGVTYVK